MSEQLPIATYGTVVGRFLVAVADGSDDNAVPDAYPVTGQVSFTPSVDSLLINSANPPVTVLPVKITANIDDAGYISLNGARGVQLVATNDTNTNPTDFTYLVEFSGLRWTSDDTGASAPVSYKAFSIKVPAGQVTDLTLTAPLPSSPGIPVVRDENAVRTAEANAVAAAADARAALAQIADGTFSGVGLVVRTGAAQALVPNEFNVIQFNTVDMDTVGGFDTATGLYTIPVTGLWNATGALRVSDGAMPVGANIGLGIGVQNGDLPGFIWRAAGALRNTYDVARSAFFVAGDKVRLYTYYETGNVANTTSATMSLSLITAAAEVPVTWYHKPATGIPASDLDPSIQGRLLSVDSLNYRFGSPVTDLGSADLNDLGVTGFYRGYGLINAPLGNSWFYFEVLRHDDSFILQRATGLNSPNTNRVYIRTRDATVWTPWVLVSDGSGAVDAGARAAQAALNDDNRLGARAQPITNGNLNDIVSSGFYGGYNLGAAPSADAYFVMVIRTTGDANDGVGRVWQQIRGYDGVNADVTYERTYRDGSWTSWVRLSNALGAIDQPARDNTAALLAGGRLGVVASNVGTFNLDDLQDNGWYNGNSMGNAPIGSNEWFFVEVVGYTNDAGAYRMQTATAFTNPSGGGMVNRQWRRTKLAGAWLPWVEVGSVTTVNGIAPDPNGNVLVGMPKVLAAESIASAQPFVSSNQYQKIEFQNVSNDTESLWDYTNNWYTIPVDGTYQVDLAVRPNDAAFTDFTNVGLGVAADFGDSPLLYWYTPSTFRNTLVYSRQSTFYAGQQVRAFVYLEGKPFLLTNASLGISLIAEREGAL